MTATTASCLDRFASKGERRVARRLVRDILAAGYCVSVHDGGAVTLAKSRDFASITDALCSTGSDTLTVRRRDDHTRVGAILLVWGNSAAELIADHSDNAAISAVVVGASRLGDKIDG